MVYNIECRKEKDRNGKCYGKYLKNRFFEDDEKMRYETYHL